AVEPEKRHERKQRRPLVAVHKRMVADDAEGARRRQRRQGAMLIGPFVARPVQRRLKRASIAQAGRAAEPAKLGVVERDHEVRRKPDRLSHFASSSRALRYVCIAFSAISMPRSNTGSARRSWRPPSAVSTTVSQSPCS